ncbi:aa3-type cytochrome c oxidase subunit IV [Amaricoccus sp.]|uniref:aa3-type cytochrome c oxidase subunit IV n=1 Tax=Amaricoccus sp. TaxID=1872485 RepID=UPI001B6F4460|nr:aa3-type cytochrome c oxidase subunit IV [Amaricoccus sp.]MBP7000463.1 aa3-type cytochrome c oxidase subunit IV [Amaricoccus sp.]
MADHSHAHAPAHQHAHGHAPAHVHGSADVAEHQKMFENFARFWVYVFGAAAAVLIFLAIFNS